MDNIIGWYVYTLHGVLIRAWRLTPTLSIE